MPPQVTLHLQETAGNPEYHWAAITRMLCHMVLSLLPDRALSELSETLVDMVKFYRHEPPISSYSEPKRLHGKRGDSFTRPSFQITTDE